MSTSHPIRIQSDRPFRIYGELIDPAALAQFASAMEQPFVRRGALMPDAHAGYSLPIGAVVATEGVIVPAWVGYDIGCGVCALPTSFSPADVQQHAAEIFAQIYREIPVGFAHNRSRARWPEGTDLPRTDALRRIFDRGGLEQLGSLGGGNHFIEVGVDEAKRVWVIIHSGSRNVGHATATHYMKRASGDGKAREGHFGFDVESREGRDYITDLSFCLSFALENRRELVRRVLRIMWEHCRGESDWDALINRNHNHAEKRDGFWIHRKGATHAEEGMTGVVPGNMRDGSFIVRGRGCAESLWSSSHGAGRIMGRKEAARSLSLESFKEALQGITAHVTRDTLDEAPMAYKDIFEVMAQQSQLVETVAHVRPILNIKG